VGVERYRQLLDSTGLGAPLLLVAYLMYAERVRTGDDSTRECISDLGDGIDGAGGGFVFANIAVGGLLGYFAWEGLDHNSKPEVACASTPQKPDSRLVGPEKDQLGWRRSRARFD
jgi:hypothetical protein